MKQKIKIAVGSDNTEYKLVELLEKVRLTLPVEIVFCFSHEMDGSALDFAEINKIENFGIMQYQPLAGLMQKLRASQANYIFLIDFLSPFAMEISKHFAGKVYELETVIEAEEKLVEMLKTLCGIVG